MLYYFSVIVSHGLGRAAADTAESNLYILIYMVWIRLAELRFSFYRMNSRTHPNPSQGS